MREDEQSGRGITSLHSQRGGPRVGYLAFSLLLHSVAALALLWFSDDGKAIAEPALYAQVIEPQEKRIVWYHLNELPKISTERPAEDSQTRAERLNNDAIIHRAPDAARDDRLVWRAPDRTIPKEKTPAANMIAVERGGNVTRTPDRKVEDKAAENEPKPAPRPFVAPVASPPAATAQIRLEEPPTFKENPKLITPDVELSALTADGKVKFSKRFVTPMAVKHTDATEAATAGALPDAPSLPGSGGASDINALIINTIHAGPVGAAPPRQSAISVGPVTGDPSDGGGRSGIQIPGVTVVPGAKAENPAEASLKSPRDPFRVTPEPSSAPQPYITTRIAPLEHTLSAPLPPSSRNIPGLIEARFRGRVVYTMLLPMKGLPGYAGDWIIWFAERQPVDGGGSMAPMRAPLPVRKPMRSDEAAPLVLSGRIRLSAMIDKTGKINSVAVIEGPEASGDAAIKDLNSWDFLPALHNREPVEIDLVVEISFGINQKTISPPSVPVLTGVDRSLPTGHN